MSIPGNEHLYGLIELLSDRLGSEQVEILFRRVGKPLREYEVLDLQACIRRALREYVGHRRTGYMSAETLVPIRHGLHMELLRGYHGLLHRGETHIGEIDLATIIHAETNAIIELEHLADALGIELDERLSR